MGPRRARTSRGRGRSRSRDRGAEDPDDHPGGGAMTRIGAVLRLPSVARVTASQLLSRLPFGMVSIAVIVHVNVSTGTYGEGGLVLGAFSVGEAVAGPLGARLLARIGTRRMLLGSGLVCASALTGLALVPVALVPDLLLGVVAGLTVPPVMPAIRALYPRLVPPHFLHALFTLDASSQEGIWVVGPLLATALVAFSPQAALLAAAGVLVCGSVWLVTVPQLVSLRLPRPDKGLGRTLANGTVVLAAVANFTLVASFLALEVGILARGGGANLGTGVTIAANALGSMAGGLLLGRLMQGRRSVVTVMATVFVFTAMCLLVDGGWPLVLLVFLAGVGFAPVTATLYSFVSRVLPEREAPEAFGWITTASLAGSAVGTAVAGYAVDRFGPAGAIVTSAGLALAGVVVAALAHGWYPAEGRATGLLIE
ncbi:MAG: MFS transporter [Amnibacterium sp.]